MSKDVDDPHDHLPGGLKDPKKWIPESGTRVVAWYYNWENKEPLPINGIFYKDSHYDHFFTFRLIGKNAKSYQWTNAAAARPATLRPED